MEGKTKFVNDGPDNKGRYFVIEGWEKPGNVFSIKRFVCQVQPQETDKETEDLVEFVLKKLNA